MTRYSEDFKCSIMTKMMPPHNKSVAEIARETGLSEGTLHKWKKQAKKKGIPVPSGEQQAERWSTQDKFSIIVETASLSEAIMGSVPHQFNVLKRNSEMFHNIKTLFFTFVKKR